ncbi:MAG TPA: hypothetical protein VF861_11095, partial [Telluria sp.]
RKWRACWAGWKLPRRRASMQGSCWRRDRAGAATLAGNIARPLVRARAPNDEFSPKYVFCIG